MAIGETMQQYFAGEEIARLITARHASSARLDSLDSLQEAYEEWLIATGQGVGVIDMFWSWNIQA